MQLGSGPLDKMRVDPGDPVAYRLPLGEDEIPLNPLLGARLRLEFLGLITCCHCGRRSKRSFGQGFCYPCFQRLAQCDGCIVKPETCHHHLGTCREPEWGLAHCMVPHIVYLANSSGLKVGITRASQVPVRWIDQGAAQALPLLRVGSRLISGLVEVLLAQSVADKTNWRTMLQGEAPALDLAAEGRALLDRHRAGLEDLRIRFGEASIVALPDAAQAELRYPVLEYPAKPASLSLDKTPVFEGRLTGIKGQYLIFGETVFNVRNHGSYHLQLQRLDRASPDVASTPRLL